MNMYVDVDVDVDVNVDNLCKLGAASPTSSKNRPDGTYRCALAFHEH